MLVDIKKSFIAGVYEIITPMHHDNRGLFHKIYHQEAFEKLNLNTKWAEQYYSVSKKDVLRGMHFQLPPFEHEKLVSCIDGEILDVVLDLRKDSKTYGQFDQFELSSEQGNSIYIPSGCAHGFYTRSESALVLYNVSTVFNSEADYGVSWNSFGMNWPVKTPMLSEKDCKLPRVEDFKTPFIK